MSINRKLIDAKSNVGIKRRMLSEFTEKDLQTAVKKKLNDNPESLPNIVEDTLYLLRRKEKLICDTFHEELFQRAVSKTTIKNSLFKIPLAGIDSLSHHLILPIILKELAAEKFGKLEEEVEIDGIKIPYDRKKNLYPAISLLVTSVSRRELQINITGDSGIIFILFYLKKCINEFIKNISKADIDIPPSSSSNSSESSETSSDSLPDSNFALNDQPIDDVGDECDELKSKPNSDNESLSVGQERNTDDEALLDSSFTSKRKSIGDQPIDDIGDAKKNKLNSDSDHEHNTEDEEETTESTSDKDADSIGVKREEGLEKQTCPDCSLIFCSLNIEVFITEDLDFELSCIEDCFDCPDSIQSFVDSIVDALDKLDLHTAVYNNSYFNINTARLVEKVLGGMESGCALVFCKILEDLANLSVSSKSKLIILLEYMSENLITYDGKSFETMFLEYKQARKNLLKFLSETGNIHAMRAALGIYFDMWNIRLDMIQILPQALHFVCDMFTDAEIGFDQLVINISMKVSEIASRQKKIHAYKLEKKEFFGKSAIIFEGKESDLLLFHNTVNNEINFSTDVSRGNDRGVFHIGLFLNSAKISFNSETKSLSIGKWKFTFATDSVLSDILLASLNQDSEDEVKQDDFESQQHEESMEKKSKEGESKKGKSKEEENKEKEKKEKENKENKKNENKAEGSKDDGNTDKAIKDLKTQVYEINAHRKVIQEEVHRKKDANDYQKMKQKIESEDGDELDSILENDEDMETDDETTEGKVSAQFIIDGDEFSKYWDPEKNKKERHFLRFAVGKDWPLKYNSPCAVLIGYNHVKSFLSHKRNCPFAVLHGKCKICEAVHVYTVFDSPIEEWETKDGLIKYKVVEPMQVEVTVQGKFYLKDGELDVEQPVHLKKKCCWAMFERRRKENSRRLWNHGRAKQNIQRSIFTCC